MEKEKVLITGGTGLLGKALCLSANDKYQIAITHSNTIPNGFAKSMNAFKANLEEPTEFIRIIKDFKPNIVIHTASMGSVDETEKNKDYARTINLEILNPLIDSMNKTDSMIVFISTNAVYDGESPPYNEKSEQRSVNYYGELKILAEELIRRNARKFVIIRPMLMYGWPLEGRRDNPFSWIVKKLSKGEPLKLVNDTVTMPLLDRDCANVCWKALDFSREDFNISGSEQITFYEFGCAIAEEFGFDKSLLSPVGSDAFPAIAKRPRDTSYDISKVRDKLGITPLGVRDGIRFLKGNLIK